MSHRICLEMLNQRGHKILKDETDKIIAIKPDQKKMIVFFSDTPKFNVKIIQIFIKLMNDVSIFHAIIIHKGGVTSFTKNIISQSRNMYFELFADQDLQYNITKHRYQPKFDRLSTIDADAFKKKYGTQFPIMGTTDPIVNFYNYQLGDIIKITKKNGYITYNIIQEI